MMQKMKISAKIGFIVVSINNFLFELYSMHSSVHKIETIFSLQNNLIWVYNHSYDYRPESLTVQLLLNKKMEGKCLFCSSFF